MAPLQIVCGPSIYWVKHVLDHFILQNCALFNVHFQYTMNVPRTIPYALQSFLVPIIEGLLSTWINLSNILRPTLNPLGSLSDDFC